MKRLAVMSFVFALVAIVANTSWAQHHHHGNHHHHGGFVGSGGGISIGIGNFGGYGGYGGGYSGYGGYGYSNYYRPVYNSGYYGGYHPQYPHYDLHVPTYYGGRSGCGGGGSIYYRW